MTTGTILNFETDKLLAKKLASLLSQAKKIILVAGAGISVSSGIPDFRSTGGLYDIVKEKYPQAVLKGQDLFDGQFYLNPKTRIIFLNFIANLKEMCEKAKPTTTHSFIQWLSERGQLSRVYTQNIDSLESRVLTETSCLIHLHGTLDFLACTICKQKISFTQTHIDLYKQGSFIDCESCLAMEKERKLLEKRSRPIGQLRPDIVLYNEVHPFGDLIASTIASDMKKRPNILIVTGTSLKVVGLKKLVKDLAQSVHSSNGLVIYVNRKEAPKSEWKNIFDYQLLGDCDQWFSFLKEEMLTEEAKPKKIDEYFKQVKNSVHVIAKQDKIEKEPIKSSKPVVLKEKAKISSVAALDRTVTPSNLNEIKSSASPALKKRTKNLLVNDPNQLKLEDLVAKK